MLSYSYQYLYAFYWLNWVDKNHAKIYIKLFDSAMEILFVSWAIWTYRNRVIFDHCNINPVYIINLITGSLSEI